MKVLRKISFRTMFVYTVMSVPNGTWIEWNPVFSGILLLFQRLLTQHQVSVLKEICLLREKSFSLFPCRLPSLHNILHFIDWFIYAVSLYFWYEGQLYSKILYEMSINTSSDFIVYYSGQLCHFFKKRTELPI